MSKRSVNLLRKGMDPQMTISGAAQVQRVIAVGDAETKELAASDSGALVTLEGSSGVATVTLPAVGAGLRFTIMAISAHVHIINGGASVIQGSYFHSANKGTVAHVAIANKTSLTLHASNPAIGDTLEFWCNGTNWYVTGLVNNAITQA